MPKFRVEYEVQMLAGITAEVEAKDEADARTIAEGLTAISQTAEVAELMLEPIENAICDFAEGVDLAVVKVDIELGEEGFEIVRIAKVEKTARD